MQPRYQNLLGIYSFFGFRLPLIEKLDLIKEAGFEATTLWWGDKFAFSEIAKDNLVKTVKNKGLYLENIHVPYKNINNLCSPEQIDRKNTLYCYLMWLEDCAKYNIPVMVMHVTDGSNLPKPGENLYNSFEIIIKTAEKFEITVAIENTERNDYIDFLLRKFDSKYLGLCYDSSHDNLPQNTGIDILTKWKHRLVTVHLSDNDGKFDKHWLPGKGCINWDKIFSGLKDYRGCITLETFAAVNTTPELFLTRAYKKAEWIRNKLLYEN